MKLLPRYLLGIFTGRFAAVLGSLTFVLMMSYMVRVFQRAVAQGVSTTWVLKQVVNLMPYQLGLSIPISYLVAMLITLHALGQTGEVTAMRAAGFAPRQILWPFSLVAAALSALLLLFMHHTSPAGMHRWRNDQARIFQQVTGFRVVAKEFIELGAWRFYAREVDPETHGLRGVRLTQTRTDGSTVQVSGKAGTYGLEPRRGFVLTLREGELQRVHPDDPKGLLNGEFATYKVGIDLTGGALERAVPTQELGSARIVERLRDEAAMPDSVRRELKTELAVRTASALAPLVFYLLVCPLGLGERQRERGASGAFGASLVVLAAFYGLLGWGIGLGRNHEALSWIAPWFSIVAGTAAGILLWKKELPSR